METITVVTQYFSHVIQIENSNVLNVQMGANRVFYEVGLFEREGSQAPTFGLPKQAERHPAARESHTPCSDVGKGGGGVNV